MPGVRDSPLLNYTDLFTHRKFMSGENASAYDQNSFAQIPQFIDILERIGESERKSLAGSLRKIEKNARNYAALKTNTNSQEQSQAVTEVHKWQYLSLQSTNLVLLKGLALWNKPVQYPVLGLQLIKYLSDARSALNIKIVEVKTRYEEYFKSGLFTLTDPHFVQLANASAVNKNEDLLFAFKNVLEACIEKRFYIFELEVAALREANQCLQDEYNLHIIGSNVDQARLLNVTMNQLGAKAREVMPRVRLNPFYSSPLFFEYSSNAGKSDSRAIAQQSNNNQQPQQPQQQQQQQYRLPVVAKLAFLQGFLNRIRNKVQRVDLISSGFGFVINVLDLEECINYLHKGLTNFAEKELRHRLESARQQQEVLRARVIGQELEINSLKSRLVIVEEAQRQHVDALVHFKANNLIYELAQISRKANDFQRFTVGLEDRIREEVTNEMQAEKIDLEVNQELLKQQFFEFKRMLKLYFNQELKGAQEQIQLNISKKTQVLIATFLKNVAVPELSLGAVAQPQQQQQSVSANTSQARKSLTDKQTAPWSGGLFKLKRGDAVDSDTNILQALPHTESSQQESLTPPPGQYQKSRLSNTKFYSNSRNYLAQLRAAEEDQLRARCTPDEDIIDDPLILNKYLNKLRTFYIIKMGAQREKQERKILALEKELKGFRDIQDKVFAKRHEEDILKKELVHTHNLLKEQERNTNKLQQELENTMFEKLRLEKLRDDLSKRVKNLEEQLKRDRSENRLSASMATEINDATSVTSPDEKLQKAQQNQHILQEQLSHVKKESRVRMRIMQDKLKVEQELKNKYAQRLEHGHFPLIQFSTTNGESSWREKCQELFAKNNQLQNDLAEIKKIVHELVVAVRDTNTGDENAKIGDLSRLASQFLVKDSKDAQTPQSASKVPEKIQRGRVHHTHTNTDLSGASHVLTTENGNILTSEAPPRSRNEGPGVNYGEDNALLIKSRGTRGGGFRNLTTNSSRASQRENKSGTPAKLERLKKENLNSTYFL